MSNSNNSSDDFTLDSLNPYAKFVGLKYSESLFEYCMNKDYFTKDTLYNFLMSSPDFTPSMLKLKKNELAQYAAIVLYNKNLLESWYKNLSDDDKNFLYEITRLGYIGTAYAQKKFNFTLKKSTYSYSWYNIIDYESPEYPIFYFCNYSEYIITIKPLIKQILLETIDELNVKNPFITDDEFTQSPFFFSEETGLEFFRNLPSILETLRSVDFFERPVNKPILKKQRDTIISFTDITPLALAAELITNYQYDKKYAEEIQNLRIDIFLKFLSCSYMNPNNYSDLPEFKDYEVEPKIFFKNLLEKFFNDYNIFFEISFLFPYIKFRNKNQHVYSMGKNKREKKYEILAFFKNWKYDTAVSFEALIQSSIPYFLYASTDMYMEVELSKRDDRYNNYGLIPFSTHNSVAMFFIPVFNNMLLVFACLGFFEISWKPSEIKLDEPNVYPFGKIEYIKMTALGRYVFGIDEELKITESKKADPIVLNTQMEIIHCPLENRFAERTLNEICEKLSPEVYCFSKDKFLKKAKSEQKINAYFELLENLSGEKLPSFWAELKQTLLSSICKLTYDDSWIIITLPLENKKLLDYIEEYAFYNTGNILKVQGGKIAVKENMLSYFKENLKRHGFVLDE